MKNGSNKVGTATRVIFSFTMLTLVGVSLFPIVPYMKEVDLPTIGLVLLAFLPWASSFLDEISISGVKVKYRELEKRVEDISKDQLKTADEILTIPRPVAHIEEQSKNEERHVDKDTLISLAQEYVKTRASLPSGNVRTNQMTAIFQKMQVLSRELGTDWIGLDEWLRSDDAGLNLAATAYLYAFPTRMKPSLIIGLIDSSTQPFIQYWALRVLNYYIEKFGKDKFENSDIKQLRDLEKSFAPHIDRGVLIRGINRSINRLETRN